MKKIHLIIVGILVTTLLVSTLVLADSRPRPGEQATLPTRPVTTDEITVTINDYHVNFPDQQPIIVDGRTLVPVRGVFEMLGFDVDWDDYTQTVILSSDDYVVNITIESDIFTTNEVRHTLDVPAQLIGERTMLPLRAVLESVGFDVCWSERTQTVYIESRACEVEGEVIVIRHNRFDEISYYEFTLSTNADNATIQAELYYHMFRSLFEFADTRYTEAIAFNVSAMQFEHTDILTRMIERFCNENEYALFLYTIRELIEKGYTNNNQDGILSVRFDAMPEFWRRSVPEVTDTLIVTNLSIIWGDMAAVHAEFRAELIDGSWVIEVTRGGVS